MKKILLVTLCSLLFTALVFPQSRLFITPPPVERVLRLSGSHRSDLEKVLHHYAVRQDSLKWQAACFLIGNMDIHFSEHFYWETSDKQEFHFDELSYPDFRTAIEHFNQLSSKEQLRLKMRRVSDLSSMTSDLLIGTIDYSFSHWNTPLARHLTFHEFCEYLLPYRSTCEPLETWKLSYGTHFSSAAAKARSASVKAVTDSIGSSVLREYFVTSGIEERSSGGMLSPSHLLFRKQGNCENLSNMTVFAMRSQGIAITFDFVPHWATSTGRHYWNCVIDERRRYLPFVGSGAGALTLKREPGKVIRITYSRQPGTPASVLPQESIPEGYMRTPNFIDVTDQYWKCAVFTVTSTSLSTHDKFLYVSVLNGLKWRPVFYAPVFRNQVKFTKMSCGVVYLPMAFRNNRTVPVASPVLLHADGRAEVKEIHPSRKIRIFIPEKESYLLYRLNKSYTLYYWDKEWKKAGTRIAVSREGLTFADVPDGTLYLLIPEYSKGKERPFTIDGKGGICYW